MYILACFETNLGLFAGLKTTAVLSLSFQKKNKLCYWDLHCIYFVLGVVLQFKTEKNGLRNEVSIALFLIQGKICSQCKNSHLYFIANYMRHVNEDTGKKSAKTNK